MTLRFAITGKKSGPEMSELIFYLGRKKIEEMLDLVR